MFNKKVVITNGNCYIAEGKDEYIVTNHIAKAKDFKWYWLITSKKDILKGVQSLYGDRFIFKTIEGR